MKSKHKHIYDKCLIKQYRKLGHREYIIWILGGQCSICGKLKYKKYLWFGKEKEYELPIVEDDLTHQHEDKGE